MCMNEMNGTDSDINTRQNNEAWSIPEKLILRITSDMNADYKEEKNCEEGALLNF